MVVDSKGASHQNLCEFYQVFTAHKNHTLTRIQILTNTLIPTLIHTQAKRVNAMQIAENSVADKRELHLRYVYAISPPSHCVYAWRGLGVIFKFRAQYPRPVLSFSCQLNSKLMLIVLELTRPDHAPVSGPRRP